jgi:hypothetical protein
MEQASDPVAEGARICADIIRELSDIRGVAGVHIMAPGNDTTVPGLIKAARASIGRLAPA